MRRVGLPPRPVPYRRRPGAYAVIRRGRRVLVTEQTGEVVEVQLPGGGLDPGEGPLAALHREALEETGTRIRIVRRLGVYRRFAWMPEYAIYAEKICHIYLAEAGLRVGAPIEADHRALWLDAARAVDTLTVPADAAFVARVFGLPHKTAFQER
ncbi:MAG: NUDIX domain-containing protein [Pseudomonadota bacterium]